MARTTMLRAQINATEAMLDRLAIALEAYRGDASAYPMSLDLSRLAGVLRIHFSISDRQIYPFMIASGQPETVRIAQLFQHEICLLGRRFDRFMQRWSASSAILANLPQFRCETEVMCLAIRSRLLREIRELLPLVDALTDPPTLRAA